MIGSPHWPAQPVVPAIGHRPAAEALDGALRAIAHRYGKPIADVVAMQLEYRFNG